MLEWKAVGQGVGKTVDQSFIGEYMIHLVSRKHKTCLNIRTYENFAHDYDITRFFLAR